MVHLGHRSIGIIAANYVSTQVTDYDETTLTEPTRLSAYCDTGVYDSITVTYDYHEQYTEEYENYWHAIKMREYWNQPKVIGKPTQPKTQPFMGFARSKLRKHKLKPEICLQ